MAIEQGKKPLLRRLKNIGMASEKLYRNTLKISFHHIASVLLSRTGTLTITLEASF